MIAIRQRRQLLRVLLGILAGAIAFELSLRPFTTALQNDWRQVPISADPDDGPVTEVRYYHEGVAVSHFSPGHARLTNNPRIAGAPTGVILGDSYVEAVQVVDDSTMGAVVERASRSAGRPLNVRQYGWPGGSVADYVDVAPEVLDRWKPLWVAVVVNRDDLATVENGGSCSPDPPSTPEHPPHTGEPRSGARVENPGPVGWVLRAMKRVWRHSSLAYEVGKRVLEITSLPSQPTPATGGATLCKALRALHVAYSSRLTVVYVASVNPFDDGVPEPTEAALLERCATEGIACVSTRARMVQEHLIGNQFSRGFVNTAPNMGHPNELGHRIIGDELWRTLSNRSNFEGIAGGSN